MDSNINISLHDISEKSFLYNYPSKKFETNKESIFDYKIDLKYSYESENEITIRLQIDSKIIETQETIGSLLYDFTFGVSAEKKISELVDNIKDREDLFIHLFAVSYSTIRGIHFAKSHGTALELGFLPLVNPEEFIRGKITRKE